MELLGSLHPYGYAKYGSWRVNYGDREAAKLGTGIFDEKTFTVTEYGSAAKAKKAAIEWQKSKQPKWNKIVADRAKALEVKYSSIIKELAADNRISSDVSFNKLNKLDKNLVKSELYRKINFPEGATVFEDLIIGGEKFRLPTSLFQFGGLENYKNAIRLLQKWKKDPTLENMVNLTRKSDFATGQVLRDFRQYLGGEGLGYGAKKGVGGGQKIKFIESIKLEEFLGDNVKTFKEIIGAGGKLQVAKATGQIEKMLKGQNPLTRGTNDYEPIIKAINKYKWNDGLTKKQNRDLIRDSLKNNQVIIDRFKRMGVPLTHNTLTRRIVNAHKTILNDSFNDRISPSLKNLSEGQLQTYLRSAQNYFPQVNRAISHTILENLKGDELIKAKEKLKIYGKLRSFLTTELGATGGALSKGFLQFDHPLSLATLKRTGNIIGALNVNPIQGDLNIWKRELDLRLSTLSKNPAQNIEALTALNKVNKVLFGKLGGDFTVTDQGIKIKSFGADPFLEANLVKGLKQNIGLRGELIKSFDTIDQSIWDKIGIKDRGIFRDRLMATADLDVNAFKAGILKWTQENPKWTKILKGSVGCLRRAAVGGGRIGLQVGGAASDVCLIKKIDENPNQIVRAFRSLPGAGKIGAIGVALGKFGPAAGKYGAIAAAGALAQPLIKQFMNDDPSTYLTDPDQQAGMLDALIEGKRPKPRSEILDWTLGGAEVGAAASAVPGMGAVYRARRKPFTRMVEGVAGKKVPQTRPGMGVLRSATIGPAMKLVSGMFTPAGLLAIEPLRIAQKRREGESWGDIATDPVAWMGPAFAPSMTKMATRGMAPGSILPKLLRLGISRGALAAMGPVGWVGLAGSLGWTGYDLWKDYKKKRGFFARDED
jgi:hypothetical protein